MKKCEECGCYIRTYKTKVVACSACSILSKKVPEFVAFRKVSRTPKWKANLPMQEMSEEMKKVFLERKKVVS